MRSQAAGLSQALGCLFRKADCRTNARSGADDRSTQHHEHPQQVSLVGGRQRPEPDAKLATQKLSRWIRGWLRIKAILQSQSLLQFGLSDVFCLR